MYGAILGDIIGSPYEFGEHEKTKEFPLFTDHSHFTDDTVMTIGIANGLLAEELDEEDDEVIKKSLIKSLQAWGRAYPNRGYGRRFKLWLYQEDPKPINSYGNGSAMRVSPVGWLYDSLDRTLHIAHLTAVISHDHPEGIKGAECVAGAIFLARSGCTKEQIKDYIETDFKYNLDRTLDEIRPTYHHIESCQESVPEAIICFLEGESFEDVIRNAVSLGGDTDTQAAIAGSIAEAYYGIDKELKSLCYDTYLTKRMREVVDFFEGIRQKSTIEQGIHYF